MRVRLKKDWRRWLKGKELVGAAAREALADKAGVEMKPKTEEPKHGGDSNENS